MSKNRKHYGHKQKTEFKKKKTVPELWQSWLADALPPWPASLPSFPQRLQQIAPSWLPSAELPRHFDAAPLVGACTLPRPLRLLPFQPQPCKTRGWTAVSGLTLLLLNVAQKRGTHLASTARLASIIAAFLFVCSSSALACFSAFFFLFAPAVVRRDRGGE